MLNIALESAMAVLSIIVSVGVSVAAGVSSAFWPQPSAAIARVSARRATIERARSLRIVFFVTSSHVHRAGRSGDGRAYSMESVDLRLSVVKIGERCAASSVPVLVPVAA